MPATEPPVKDLAAIAAEAGYPIDAFLFIQRGLDFTVQGIHGELDEQTEAKLDADEIIPARHISGAQLCDGLRRFAIQEYGLMARGVLRRWKIHRCEDFGRIVFAMVEAGMMHKTEDDRLEDFAGLFDFGTAFAGELVIRDA